MITILIRTSNRPKKFKRCIDSVINQTYKDWKVIVCIDGDDYVPNHEKISKFEAFDYEKKDYYWNLFCNDLKEKVNEGHFFFLDDDDVLFDDDVLLELSKKIKDNQSYICKMKRNHRIFPNPTRFKHKIVARKDIGMPCIILHHSDKQKQFFDDKKAADYRFIKELSSKIFPKWIDIILVDVQGEGKAKKEYQ